MDIVADTLRAQRRWAFCPRTIRGKRARAIFCLESIDSLAARELIRRGGLDRPCRGVPARFVRLKPRGRYASRATSVARLSSRNPKNTGARSFCHESIDSLAARELIRCPSRARPSISRQPCSLGSAKASWTLPARRRWAFCPLGDRGRRGRAIFYRASTRQI